MEIEKAVEAADAILVCLSKGSITKEGYVQRELRSVLDFADYKPEGTLYIIPVRLEECEPPRRLRSWQYADYFEGQRDRAFQRLLVSLKRRADALEQMDTESERNQIEESEKREAKEEIAKQTKPAPVSRNVIPTLFIVGSVILLFLICGGIGVNYLIKKFSTNSPVATSSISTETSEPPISTSAPVTPTSQLTSTSNLGIGSTMIGENGETLVYVPAGEFTMGSNDSDAPIHTVYLDAFWIDQTEVTNKQYKACVDAGTCEPPSNTRSETHPNYYGNPEFDNYPVVYVNWDKANRYCKVWWTDGSLPTEAQWEKAARGTDARTYPWGEGIDTTYANYSQNVDTTEVGSYPSGQSPYGAYDMVGNVWEWVNDWYGENYYKDSASSNNPVGPESGKYRVLRGGTWDDNDYNVRSSFRLWYDPTDRSTTSVFDVPAHHREMLSDKG